MNPTSSASQSGEAVPRRSAQDEPNYKALYTELKEERDRLLTTLTKVNGIRNSIIGVQGFNWSEHAYPLVAALEEAGFAGMEYPEARANVGTLIEQIKAAEQALSELKREVLEKVGPFAEAAAWGWEELDERHWVNCRPLNRANGPVLTIRDFRALSSLHEKLSSIGGSSSTETAASLADGKLTAGEAQRKSEEDEALSEAMAAVDRWLDREHHRFPSSPISTSVATIYYALKALLPPHPNPSARGEL